MEVFYFGEPSRRLFGVLDGPGGNARAGLVFCPPFGEEMVSTYSRLARWSKEIAKEGFAVLRFHPYGTGESDGTFADFSFAGVLRDTATAVSYLREHTGVQRVGLFGLRFGGFVAVQAALAESPDFLLLWSPIINLRKYFRDLLRMRLTAELVHLQADRVKFTTRSMVEDLEAGRTVDILGYEFSSELYQQMTAGPAWPQSPPSPKMLWLSRLSERTPITSLPGDWTNQNDKVNLQFLSEIPFWEDFSSVFPGKFDVASRAWLAAR